MKAWNVSDIERTEDAILQRRQLERVQDFLSSESAEEDLIETIDIAITDIEGWIDSQIEAALQSGVLQPSGARA
jgi:hypothetical protein